METVNTSHTFSMFMVDVFALGIDVLNRMDAHCIHSTCFLVSSTAECSIFTVFYPLDPSTALMVNKLPFPRLESPSTGNVSTLNAPSSPAHSNGHKTVASRSLLGSTNVFDAGKGTPKADNRPLSQLKAAKYSISTILHKLGI